MLRKTSDHPSIYRVAEALRSVRDLQGRNRFEVADMAGFPVRTLLHLENGSVSWKDCRRYLRQWTTALGVDMTCYSEWLSVEAAEHY